VYWNQDRRVSDSVRRAQAKALCKTTTIHLHNCFKSHYTSLSNKTARNILGHVRTMSVAGSLTSWLLSAESLATDRLQLRKLKSATNDFILASDTTSH
jgi:hypothetical protein